MLDEGYYCPMWLWNDSRGSRVGHNKALHASTPAKKSIPVIFASAVHSSLLSL